MQAVAGLVMQAVAELGGSGVSHAGSSRVSHAGSSGVSHAGGSGVVAQAVAGLAMGVEACWLVMGAAGVPVSHAGFTHAPPLPAIIWAVAAGVHAPGHH